MPLENYLENSSVNFLKGRLHLSAVRMLGYPRTVNVVIVSITMDARGSRGVNGPLVFRRLSPSNDMRVTSLAESMTVTVIGL